MDWGEHPISPPFPSTRRGILPLRFSFRILNIDQEVADRWGHLSGLTSARGAHVAVIKGLLAAFAIQHNLTLVTHNTKDFAANSVSLFNPWAE